MTEKTTPKEITGDHVEEFAEYLITVCGGRLDLKTGEIQDSSGEPILIETSSGKKPMIVYRELTKLTNHVILNVFSDLSEHSSQLRWFWDTKSNELASMLQMIIEAAIEYKPGTISDDMEYTRLSITSLCPSTEKKLLENFKKIQAKDLLGLLYKKSEKTAQLQTKVFDDDFMKTLNIPTKQWNAIHKVFKFIFKVDTEKEFNGLYKFTSSLTNIPGCESQLRVFFQGLRTLEKYYIAFYGPVDFKLEMFERNLQNIQTFYGLTNWIAQASGTTADIKKAEFVKPLNPLDAPPAVSGQISLGGPIVPRNPLDPPPASNPLMGGRAGRIPQSFYSAPEPYGRSYDRHPYGRVNLR